MSPQPDDWTTATASATAALEPASSAAPLERECPHWPPAFPVIISWPPISASADFSLLEGAGYGVASLPPLA